MNMRRGFFRLWVDVSVVWIAFALVVSWQRPRPFDPDLFLTGKPDPDLAANVIMNAAYLAFAPPILSLALGAALFWAARGFKARGN
jgi:hypothetical protein